MNKPTTPNTNHPPVQGDGELRQKVDSLLDRLAPAAEFGCLCQKGGKCARHAITDHILRLIQAQLTEARLDELQKLALRVYETDDIRKLEPGQYDFVARCIHEAVHKLTGDHNAQ